MNDFEGVLALIIEDDASSIKVLRSLLTQVGADAIAISDTSLIEDELRRIERPDVIFIDLEMPANNGYSVLEIIQDDTYFDGVPTVAYTTHISHLNEARTAGFHSFLGKPIDGDRLPEFLDAILKGSDVWEVPD
jgi:CheY-like chemotaxis protein